MEIRFTLHARERMFKRKISKEEIILAIQNPDKTLKKAGKYLAQKDIGRAKIEVVYEKDNYINVVTIYYI